MAISNQERAEKSAAAMWAEDRASQGLGMVLDVIAPGRAKLSMTVQDNHVNGHDTCHGGFIFTLADSAFAFACNSYNQRTVAQHCLINFLAPAKLGDRLTAEAVEVSRAGRSGIYDITVMRDDGTAIASFRGMSRTVSGNLFDEETV